MVHSVGDDSAFKATINPLTVLQMSSVLAALTITTPLVLQMSNLFSQHLHTQCYIIMSDPLGVILSK